MPSTTSISIFDHLRQHIGNRLELLHCTKATLVHLSHTLEDMVLRDQLPAMLFTGFQESSHWREETERYRQLAQVAQQVCIFAGGELSGDTLSNELRITLSGSDPLRQEWFLAILADRFSVVLCGQDQKVSVVEEATRQFATLWTFEPELVGEVLDLLEQVIANYRPDQLAKLRASRQQFPPTAPDARLLTNFTREMVRFEEQLHQQLSEREQFLRGIYDGIGVSIFVVDVSESGDFYYAGLNPVHEQATGISDRQLRGRRPEEVLDAANAAAVRAHYQDCVRVAAPITYEEQIVFQGQESWWLTTLRPLHNTTGQITRLIGTSQQISARKHAELDLLRTNELLRSRNQELERRTREIGLLSSMGELLQACRNADEANAVMRRFLPQLFPQNDGMLAISGTNDLIEMIADWGTTGLSAETFLGDDCWALRRGRAHLMNTPHTGLYCAHLRPPLPPQALCVPLMAQGRSIGVLHLRLTDGQLSTGLQQLAQTVGEQLALALANLRLRERLRGESIRDPLTGLFNRRYLAETLPRELRRASRQHSALGVIMIDIDHFKQINDQHGHAAGDAVLRGMGRLLQTSVREEDIACRYGGEEFTLVLPDADIAITRTRAEQIRQAVAHMVVAHGDLSITNITASLGVAIYSDHGDNGDLLLHAADQALYNAKEAGRDRVMMAATPMIVRRSIA